MARAAGVGSAPAAGPAVRPSPPSAALQPAPRRPRVGVRQLHATCRTWNTCFSVLFPKWKVMGGVSWTLVDMHWAPLSAGHCPRRWSLKLCVWGPAPSGPGFPLALHGRGGGVLVPVAVSSRRLVRPRHRIPRPRAKRIPSAVVHELRSVQLWLFLSLLRSNERLSQKNEIR